MLRRSKSHRGQGLVEYGLLIVMILGILVLVVPTITVGWGTINSAIGSSINSTIGGGGGGNGGNPTPTPTGGGNPTATPTGGGNPTATPTGGGNPTATPTGGSQCSGSDCIVIDPPNPLPGSPVWISGGGFCPDSSVQALWDGASIGTPVNADGGGLVAITFTPTVEQSAPGSNHIASLTGLAGDCSGSFSPPGSPITISGHGSDISDTFNRPNASSDSLSSTTPPSGYYWHLRTQAGLSVYKNRLTTLGQQDNNYDSEILYAPLPFPLRLTIDVISGDGPSVGLSLNGGYTVFAGWGEGADFNTNSCTPDAGNNAVLVLIGPNSRSCRTTTISTEPSTMSLTVTADTISAMGMTIGTPGGVIAANNPWIMSSSAGGGRTTFDNLFITSDLTGPVPNPADGYVPYTGQVSLTQGSPDASGYIPMLATSTQNLDPTKYYLIITNDKTGVEQTCGSGTTCQATVQMPTSGSETYVAEIADLTGNDVRATSNSITLSAPQPSEAWSVSLSKIAVDKYGAQLTATVGNDTLPASTIISIWNGNPANPSASTQVVSCSQTVTCGSLVNSRIDATYYATVSYQNFQNIQDTTSTVSTSAPETSLDPAWSVTLSQTPALDGGITLTATSNQDISLAPYYIFILDGSGTPLQACMTGTTCEFEVPSTGPQTYVATVSTMGYGSGFIATSDVIAIP